MGIYGGVCTERPKTATAMCTQQFHVDKKASTGQSAEDYRKEEKEGATVVWIPEDKPEAGEAWLNFFTRKYMSRMKNGRK